MIADDSTGSRQAANVAVFLFLSGSQAMIPFVPLYARSLGADAAAIGFILGGYHMLPLLVAIPLGSFVQRWGTRRSMALASLSGALAPLLVLRGGVQDLVAGLLLFGVSSLTIVIAGQVEILVTVPSAHWDRAIGIFAFSTSLGLIVGPLVGGFLSELGGLRLNFYGTAALASAAALVMLRSARRRSVRVLLPAPPPALGVLATLVERPTLSTALLCSLSSEFALSFWNAFFPLLLAGRGFSPQVIGLFFSLRGVATASIRPFLGVLTHRISRPVALIVCMAVMALTLVACLSLTRSRHLGLRSSYLVSLRDSSFH